MSANCSRASPQCQIELFCVRLPVEGSNLDINVRKRSEIELIQLRGPLRLGTAVDEFRRTLEEATAGGDLRIVLNMAEVPIVDSSGIGVLVKAVTSLKQRGGALKLVNPSRLTVQTLRIVGVLNLFDVFEDEESAIASFK